MKKLLNLILIGGIFFGSSNLFSQGLPDTIEKNHTLNNKCIPDGALTRPMGTNYSSDGTCIRKIWYNKNYKSSKDYNDAARRGEPNLEDLYIDINNDGEADMRYLEFMKKIYDYLLWEELKRKSI